MNNIAATYSALGRHQDALVMEEKTLRVLQATLPPSHPHVKQAQQFVRGCEDDAARRS